MPESEQVNFGRKVIALAEMLEEMHKAAPMLRSGLVTPLVDVCRGFLEPVSVPFVDHADQRAILNDETKFYGTQSNHRQ